MAEWTRRFALDGKWALITGASKGTMLAPASARTAQHSSPMLGKQVRDDPERNRPMRERTPAGRFVEPVEVADLVLFLASNAPDMSNGSAVLIDGGYVAL